MKVLAWIWFQLMSTQFINPWITHENTHNIHSKWFFALVLSFHFSVVTFTERIFVLYRKLSYKLNQYMSKMRTIFELDLPLTSFCFVFVQNSIEEMYHHFLDAKNGRFQCNNYTLLDTLLHLNLTNFTIIRWNRTKKLFVFLLPTKQLIHIDSICHCR